MVVNGVARVARLWVPGVLTNPLRGGRSDWHARFRWSKGWRDRVAQRVKLVVGDKLGAPEDPKIVAFFARVISMFDDDGLRAAIKPARDGLVRGGILHDDSPRSGHVFFYGDQIIERTHPGLLIEIRRTAP